MILLLGSSAQSLYDTQLFNLPQHNGSTGIVGTAQLTGQGFQVDYTGSDSTFVQAISIPAPLRKRLQQWNIEQNYARNAFEDAVSLAREWAELETGAPLDAYTLTPTPRGGWEFTQKAQPVPETQ